MNQQIEAAVNEQTKYSSLQKLVDLKKPNQDVFLLSAFYQKERMDSIIQSARGL